MESAELLRLVRMLAKKQEEKFFGQVILHFQHGKLKKVEVHDHLLWETGRGIDETGK